MGVRVITQNLLLLPRSFTGGIQRERDGKQQQD